MLVSQQPPLSRATVDDAHRFESVSVFQIQRTTRPFRNVVVKGNASKQGRSCRKTRWWSVGCSFAWTRSVTKEKCKSDVSINFLNWRVVMSLNKVELVSFVPDEFISVEMKNTLHILLLVGSDNPIVWQRLSIVRPELTLDVLRRSMSKQMCVTIPSNAVREAIMESVWIGERFIFQSNLPMLF